MNDWKKVKLGEIGEIVTGKTPKTNIIKNYGGDIPFLTPSDDLFVKYIVKTNKTITDIGLLEVKNCLLPPNAVCVSCIGSDLGKVVKTTKPTVTNQQINSIILNNGINSDFVYYTMIILGKQLNYLSKTSTAVPIINKTTFSSFEINLPPLETQEKIAAILSSLDDKIEINNKINANLESQAQAIFKHYFVDNPQKENWKKGKLEDIINIYDSKRIPLSSNCRNKMGKKYPYYGAASLMDYVDDYLFDGIYLLLGEDGTVIDNKGYPILQYVWGKFWVNNHAHILKGKNGFNVESLYVLLKQINVKSIVTGAVQPKINQENLKNIEIIIPSELLLVKFNKITEKIFKKIRFNKKENTIFAEIRDSILPKLMNGEIKI